ncbi:transketolase [Eremococcus coleocola]|uniref:Transketolase n=1 Tax=Eremococcus coleocola ACS-139-V-Col8 TaxID=908337 RepID=E4KMI9_9LACT|nr:transketolase [Eremococcus coleocola]EFR31858.1 transketolase [Eremococcus coleocola ACS-139-V-Col8]
MFTKEDQLAVSTLRALSIDQIEAANSGHPGLPLGAAPMAYSLWTRHLNVNPKASNWPNRDRFVLSAGHGSALLYSLLHLSGFDVSINDLKDFRQLGSKTPGHPEVGHTDGVEVITGPLGQGLAQAVGLAMAETHTAALYNTPDFPMIDHYTYTLVGDGDLMEGISYEAASLAGRQALDKLIVLYDSNDISLDGDLNLAFNEDIQGRFEAMHWHYQKVTDGNDLQAISDAIQAAKDHKGQPSIIEIKTVIGFGSPKQGTSAVHGSPLGADAWAQTRQAYGYDQAEFTVPEVSQAQFDQHVLERGQKAYQAWQDLYEAYQKAEPEKAKLFDLAFKGDLPKDYDAHLTYQAQGEKDMASRASSGKAIQALAQGIPYLWGGSADLSGSNKTMIDASGDFMPEARDQRNIWFGVREFAMGAILNGITLHGGSRVFGGTFFVFSDYLRAAIRLAALGSTPSIFVLTHDSIAVGEDGPTHEPVEHLAAFRAMPNLNVLRPADSNETFAAWKIALESKDRPSLLVLSRQNLPLLPVEAQVLEEGVRRGAYVVSAQAGDQAQGILIASGSEVSLAIEAQAMLKAAGHDVAVVSMPAQNIFDQQDEEYKESILPDGVRKRMAIEMGASSAWYKYVGLDGKVLGIDQFGASGKGDAVVASYGFTADNIVSEYLAQFDN